MLSLLLHTSIYEWVAFFCSVAYVSFAAYQKKIAWIFAFISSAIYVYLCFDSRLYLDSFLQMFYVLAAVYGWITWSRSSDEKRLSRKPLKFHLISMVIIAVLAMKFVHYFLLFNVFILICFLAFIYHFQLRASR